MSARSVRFTLYREPYEDEYIAEGEVVVMHRSLSLAFSLFLSVALAGCHEAQRAPSLRTADSWGIGPYSSSHTTLKVTAATLGEELTVELWYPGSAPAPSESPLTSFERSSEAREALEELLQAAPESCPTASTQSHRDGQPRTDLGARPLVIFSHCHNCGRYSSFSLAERLASHGLLVLSVDHAGALPFLESSQGELLSRDQLDVRVSQIIQLLDVTLDDSLFEDSALLRGLEVDPERVGIFGHSFGSVTAGRVAQLDARISAVAGLAAPMENLLLPGVEMSEIKVPVLLVLAEEDNSIQEIGNTLLRANYDDANPPVWRVDLADAGHWSVSDLCGLTEQFLAGCGAGIRHSPGRAGESFEFIPVKRGIQLTRDYLTAFFLAHLSERDDALQRLRPTAARGGVQVYERRE